MYIYLCVYIYIYLLYVVGNYSLNYVRNMFHVYVLLRVFDCLFFNVFLFLVVYVSPIAYILNNSIIA